MQTIWNERNPWEEIHSTPEAIIDRFKGSYRTAGLAVLDLSPGRELNILVGKYVMGHKVITDATMGEMEGIEDVEGKTIWCLVERYSEDVETAQEVVEKMIQEGYLDALSWHTYGNGKYTPAEAICKRAFIKKVLGQKE